MDIGHAVVDCARCSHATASDLRARTDLSHAQQTGLRTRGPDTHEFLATKRLAPSCPIRVRGDQEMMLPQDIDYEIHRMGRQAEAVTIYLGQHRGNSRC